MRLNNPWLKQYKTAKNDLKKMKIVLYSHGGVFIPGTERSLSPIVEYDSASLEVVGFYILDINGCAVYGQNLVHPVKLNADWVKVKIDLRKLKVENKWYLQDLLPEQDYI